MPFKIFRNFPHQTHTNTIDATLVIAFYNHLNNLKLIFASLENQTHKNFEIIIADDGSQETCVKELHQYLETSPLKVLHLWQADSGFRKNRILNFSIINAKSDYIIFIDGDCILHPEFIKETLHEREKNKILSGRTLEMDSQISKKLNPEKIKNQFIEKNIYKIVFNSLFMKNSNASKGLYFKSPWLRKIINKKPRALLGRNISLYKEKILAINGFDMRYEGPGTGEDSDIDFRLRLIGVNPKSVMNICVQYHVYHKIAKRANANEALFNKVKEQKNPVTPYGIKELLKEIQESNPFLLSKNNLTL